MSTQVNSNLSEQELSAGSKSNEPDKITEYFQDVKRGTMNLLTGVDKVDAGRSMIVSSLLLIGSIDEEYRMQLAARSAALVTKRTDENKTEVDAARAYFRDMMDGTSASDRLTQKDEPERMARDKHNNKVVALDQAATFAAFCILAIDHAKVWQSLSAPKNKANRGNIMMKLDAVSILWPDRKKTIEAMESDAIMLSNRAGAWRFSALETIGKVVAELRGLRKATAARATPLRDAAKAVTNSIEANDAKVLQSPETRLEAFNALIAFVDLLNDRTVSDHLDSEKVKPFREHVIERMADVRKALTESQLKKTGTAA